MHRVSAPEHEDTREQDARPCESATPCFLTRDCWRVVELSFEATTCVYLWQAACRVTCDGAARGSKATLLECLPHYIPIDL